MIAGLVIAVGLVALVVTTVAWVTATWQYKQDASNDRKAWNAAIVDQLVGSTPTVARALDTPEPTLPQWLVAPAFRVPPSAPPQHPGPAESRSPSWSKDWGRRAAGTVTAVWVDR